MRTLTDAEARHFREQLTEMDRAHELVEDGDGIVRFRRNAVIDYILMENMAGRPVDLNRIWALYVRGLFPEDDIREFYRLIGYSVGGYREVFPR